MCYGLHMVTRQELTSQVAERVQAAIEAADRTQAWVSRNSGIPLTTLRRRLVTGDFTVGELAMISEVLSIKVGTLAPDEFRAAEVA